MGNRGIPRSRGSQDSTEITVAALAVLIVLAAISVILFCRFMFICGSIRRIDKRGTLRPESLNPRHHMLAFASRWDDNRPDFA